MILDSVLNYPVQVHETWNIQDASKIKTFMECPRKYFYNYVLGWEPEGINIHLIFGSAWHEAMAVLLTKGYESEHINDAFNAFLDYFRQYVAEEDDAIYSPKIPSRAFNALIGYVNQWRSDDRDVEVVTHNDQKMIEIGGQIALTNEYQMAFKMDSILKDGSGVFSREHKTASSAYNWMAQWDLSMQVGTYHFVLDCLYPENEVKGIQMNGTVFKKTKDNAKSDAIDPFRHFEYLRGNIFKTKEQMQNWYSNTVWWFDSIKQNFNALAECSDSDPTLFCFPMNTTSCGNWTGCKYKDFCVSWMNPLRHLDRLPIGYSVRFWNPLQEDEIKVRVDIGKENSL